MQVAIKLGNILGIMKKETLLQKRSETFTKIMEEHAWMIEVVDGGSKNSEVELPSLKIKMEKVAKFSLVISFLNQHLKKSCVFSRRITKEMLTS